MELVAYTRDRQSLAPNIFMSPWVYALIKLNSSSIELGYVTLNKLVLFLKKQEYKNNRVMIFIVTQETETNMFYIWQNSEYILSTTKHSIEADSLKRSSDPSSEEVELPEEAESSSQLQTQL